MTEYILSFTNERADLAAVGGKGMSLARMARAGLPVPGGFYVSTAAYHSFVEANQLGQFIQQSLAGVGGDQPEACERASASISLAFESGRIPADLAGEILAAYSQLDGDGKVPVAVRSSATAEDLPGASFAGQQETYLNIRGADALLAAVKRCWASLWTGRAISYRLNNAIDQETVALAVVIQRMVFADAAGVLFTANPVNGNRSQALINAAWGLGEAVVSGAVSPDTITVDRVKGKVLTYETADKAVMTVRTSTGTEEQPVPDHLRRKAVLTRSRAVALAGLGGRVEALYGTPLDIEWVLVDGEFQIVQARPITTLPPEWTLPVANTVYARGSLAEHTPGPVTPLFATLGLALANHATLAMWQREIGKDSERLMVDGGFYITINGFVYGGMRMGPGDIVSITLLSLARVKPFFSGSVERWKGYSQKFHQVVDGWEARPLDTYCPQELLDAVRAVFNAACIYFTDIQTCLPAASMSEVFFTRFYNSFIKRRSDPPATVLLLGSDTRSLKAEKSLFDLAEWIRKQPDLAERLLALPTDEFLRNDPPDGIDSLVWQEWLARFEHHRETFGKTAFEFDFAVPTPYEKPDVILEALRANLHGSVGNPYLRQQEALDRRATVESAILRRTIPPFRGWFQRLLHWTQATNPMREDSINDMGYGHLLVRRMLAELGTRLVQAGGLTQPDQIYWLEESELVRAVNALQESGTLTDLTGPIETRRAEWTSRQRLAPPVMLPEKNSWSRFVHNEAAREENGKTVLRGLGTSSGVVTATARVLLGPEDFGRMQPGDVLVAVTTTPAWTPLFALASAVVTDIGGPLSHSSIVAREYNIPAVMAARGATRTIRDGQRVTVDGLKGTVILEE